jgi:hypothetical protein
VPNRPPDPAITVIAATKPKRVKRVSKP